MKIALILILKIYKKILSPTLERLFGGGCRFYPTCSEFAIESITRYGTLKGGILAVQRVLRCNPLSSGFFDPVPEFPAGPFHS